MERNFKVGFYKFSSFSLVNERLFNSLSELYTTADIEVIDVEDIYPRKSLRNIISTISFYFIDILTFRRPIKGMLIHNPHYFKKVHQRATAYSKSQVFDLTIQTQTLWDVSTPGIPNYIYTDHTELAYIHYKNFGRKSYPKKWVQLEKKAYSNAEVIFTTSTFCKKSLVTDYNVSESKIEVVYSGINIPLEIRKSFKTEQKINIVFIGTHWERKGGPFLLEAYKRLRKKNKDVGLIIVGSNPTGIVDLEGIEILGFVEPTRIPQILHQSHIFCMPSIAEPSSVAMVEAYAYGLPVVTTKVGGSPDRVIDGKTGYLVDYGDVEQLYSKLNDLVENPEKRIKFASNGMELIEKQFNWTTVAQKVISRIEESR